jgi:hypothetical protein
MRSNRAIRELVENGDDTEITKILAKNPVFGSSNSMAYPDVHRIADIQIGDTFYRITRCISEGELLSIEKTTVPSLDEPGVPISLKGDRLKRWADEEESNPSKEPVNWMEYI